MQKITERIDILIKELGKSKNQFAKETNTSSAMVSQITTRQENFRVDILQKIISTFPAINANWLLNGNGEMFLNNTKSLGGVDGGIDGGNKALEKKLLLEALGYDSFGSDEYKFDYYLSCDINKIEELIRWAFSDLEDVFKVYNRLVEIVNIFNFLDYNNLKTHSMEFSYGQIRENHRWSEFHKIGNKKIERILYLKGIEDEVEYGHKMIDNLVYKFHHCTKGKHFKESVKKAKLPYTEDH